MVLWAIKGSFEEEKKARYVEWVFRGDIEQPEVVRKQVFELLVQEEPGEELEGKYCIICYVEFSKDQKVISLPCNSEHVYHAECLKVWMENQKS